MGKKKAKSSRKGKKEWRSNISTADLDDFFSEATKDAQSGGSLSGLPAKSLFFLDSSPDLSVKRKIEKQRAKVLHCESLLQRNEFVQVIPAPKRKKPKMMLPSAAKRNSLVQMAEATVAKSDGNSTSMLVDLWEDKDGSDTKVHKKTSVSSIPAVEIEPPGCSFNPSFESHQDSLALAVAAEMQKIYQRELGPEPVPKTVPGSGIDEEEMFFLDVDDGEDEDQETHAVNGVEQQRSVKAKRLTRADINRRARRKEQLKAELEAKEQERVLKEIDCLPDIIKKIEKEDQEKQRRHIRRVVAKQEKAKSGPPRLGKYKFEPAPVQVLLSEEVTGSLRQLKACSTLAKDRFKSLEKRGLVVPQAKHRRR
ncbi:ribosome biogenesis protein NOP53 [Nymphaea colorata]|nr:ribosome biogenesis protein NOP53 [Nymphaea colorata]